MNFLNYNIPKIERHDSPSGRRYKTPEGNFYPSVTTIVGSIGDKTYIEEWREKVGAEFADKYTKESADRGTLIHQCCEDYLLGKKPKFDMFQRTESDMFNHLLPILDSIEEVHAMETTLWSDKLKCAGTVDLIAKHHGELKVIDWKNSRRYKDKEDIPGYFAQMAAYSAMFWERTNIPIRKIMVAITVEDYGLLTYEEDVRNHLSVFINARKQYGDL